MFLYDTCMSIHMYMSQYSYDIYGMSWVRECSTQCALLGNVFTDIHSPISLGWHDTYLALVLSVTVTHMLSRPCLAYC